MPHTNGRPTPVTVSDHELADREPKATPSDPRRERSTLIALTRSTLARARATVGACSALACVTLAWAAAGAAASPLPAISVEGNQLVAGGAPVRLIGVNRSGTEYECSGDDGAGRRGYGIFAGPTDQGSVDALKSWDINAVAVAVALPLNEACWLGDAEFGLKPRKAIESYVELLRSGGIYVILRLAAAAPGHDVFPQLSPGNTSFDEIPMADADNSLRFWSSLAEAFTAARLTTTRTGRSASAST